MPGLESGVVVAAGPVIAVAVAAAEVLLSLSSQHTVACRNFLAKH